MKKNGKIVVPEKGLLENGKYRGGFKRGGQLNRDMYLSIIVSRSFCI